jgi:hypothetical protein
LVFLLSNEWIIPQTEKVLILNIKEVESTSCHSVNFIKTTGDSLVYCTELIEEKSGQYQYQESFYQANQNSDSAIKKTVNKIISSDIEFQNVKTVIIEGDTEEATFFMSVGIVVPEFPFNENNTNSYISVLLYDSSSKDASGNPGVFSVPKAT